MNSKATSKNITHLAPDKTLLMQAAEDSNLGRVKQLLNEGANPSEANAKGETALHLAVSNKDEPEVLQIVKELKAYGANLNQQDEEGNTPLHVGIKTVNLNGVSALLELEADVTKKNGSCFGNTPLDEAKLLLGNVHFLIAGAKNENDRKTAESLYEKAQYIALLLNHFS